LPLLRPAAEQLAVAIANAHLHQTVKTLEAEYRSLVENIPKLIFRLDLLGYCVFVTRAMQTILGWPNQTVMRAPLGGRPGSTSFLGCRRALDGQ
jgi:PAS domain-containing protein